MKYAVLSTDATKEYYELLPLVCYSWRKIGYTPFIITLGIDEQIREYLMFNCGAHTIGHPGQQGVRHSTMAQLLRLFAFKHFNEADILVTADADMVIAKDIFHCNDGFTNYGYDLTGRSELPICYNIATAKVWGEMMGLFKIPDSAFSDNWESYWSTDQKLLTERATIYGFHRITFVNRGNQNKHGLPTGRWDRHDWNHIPDDIIDVHMLRNSWDAQIQVFQRLWPGEDYSFILKFRDELAAIQH